MDEKSALNGIKHRDEAALAWIIDRYAPYVNTIIYNIIGASMTAADLEEVASDVFLTLWSKAEKVQSDKLKAFLSGVARNKAKEKTRKIGQELPLEDDIIIISDLDIEREFEAEELASFIKRAVLAMELPDREIFLRHYYYYQALAQISVEMEINVSTVKTRLRRGREKLKEILHEGGYSLGNENI